MRATSSTLVAAAVAVAAMALPVDAEPPSTVPVQGVLRDNAGTLVPQGRFAMTLRLYPSEEADEAVWSAKRPPGGGDCTGDGAPPGCVDVEQGVFTVQLGDVETLTPELLEEHGTLWLGISVEGEPELPRKRLGTVGWAMSARRATVAGDLDCTNCVGEAALKGQPGQWTRESERVYVEDAQVGIGTTEPSTKLQVDGAVTVADSPASCDAAHEGAIRYDPDEKVFLGCNGDRWKPFDASLGSGPGVAAKSCEAILDAGGTQGDGFYWLDPDGSGGQPPFEAYCDMSTAGGGWTLLLNLDSGDGEVHHWGDTTFWTGTSTVGEESPSLQQGHKSPAYSRLADHAEVLVLLHDAGSPLGWARYELKPAHRDTPFRELVANLDDTTITGPRLASSGTSGAQHNPDRDQSLSGDIFIDQPEPLVVNKGSGWTADQNLNRLATTLSNGDYDHTFAGLGGRHQSGGWGTRYESAPIAAYCDLRSAYGDESNYLKISGDDLPVRDQCKGSGFAFIPADTAILVR